VALRLHGTLRMIDRGRTVGEIARELPNAARVFERHGIDYCCGGRRSLEAACQAKGLDVERICTELAGEPQPAARDVSAFADLIELLDHIVSTHHTFTRTELARLVPLAGKTARVHGLRHPELHRVEALVSALAEDLEDHMVREEQVLFPYLVPLEATGDGDRMPRAPFGSVAYPIGRMEMEHEAAGEILTALNEATSSFVVPSDACGSFRALYEGLAALERDLHQHIHLENNVAFPRALEIERALGGRAREAPPRVEA
jgi:regulator of cell morphogenesis and NO signaling